MAANINIYQGDQIGGCITVISTDKTKIVIDFGENLPGTKKETNIEFDWAHEKVDAVFFTHYHGDHIGRFMEIPDDVDLYMGEVTFKVMLNIRKAIHDDAAVKKLSERRAKGSITFVERAVPIQINNDITVTGYSVDHSAYDAFMYLVEADGTNILHTGDFRDHGHRGQTFKNGKKHNTMLDVIKYYVHKGGRPVDILITEGTMMGERANEKKFSEKDLLAWAKEYFKEHRYIFLKVSSTNVDTIASFYQAAKANGMNMYANSYILKQFRVYRTAGQKYGTRIYDFRKAKKIPFLSDSKEADNKEAYRILDDMRKNGFVAIVSEYDHYERVIDELSDVKPEMIYSMWEGYLDPEKAAYNKELADFCKKYHAFQKHTSGHAYPEFIAKVITEVNPKQLIWPIHTEYAKGFKNLNISDELKGKVKK
ncbi:MBL fold metallo-hydrolase [Oribacterium sp. P6A1]|uniref:MBL fold metallo-hydrolase n=1 Tax=Oribacterium sp. P6A1 TaxID=1410612 RepID=UPI00055EEDE6|nr:MBL fold metallo-hydrolase [Oribacterium sp. P6A1]